MLSHVQISQSGASKCAKRARAFSAKHACSGGANIADHELLAKLSAPKRSDVAQISQLYSHFCSSQRCFNQYVKTYRSCSIDLKGTKGNATASESVSLQTFSTINIVRTVCT